MTKLLVLGRPAHRILTAEEECVLHKTSLSVKLFSISLGVTLCLSGCAKPGLPNESPAPQATTQAQTTPQVPVTPEPEADLGAFADDAVKARAAKLAESYTEKGFPREASQDKDNGPAFLYLAATSSSPDVQLEALKKLDSVYTTSSTSKTQAQADENYDKVVLHFLNSSDDAQRYYALEASGDSLRKDGSPQVLERLIEIGSSDPNPAARFGAMSAFAKMGHRSDNSDVIDLYLKAYKDEPETAQIALKWTGTGFARANQRDDVKAAMVELTKHENPAVRGEAAFDLGQVFNDDSTLVIETIKPLLKDKSPYVRAKALDGLSYLKDPEVLKLIAPSLDDSATTNYRMPITNLLGKSGNHNYTTFGWSRVDGTALKSLERASGQIDRKTKFELGKIDYKTKDKDITSEVERAKAWLAKNAT